MAPEVFNQVVYDEKCDIWSIGVIMYAMLTGKPPFFGASDEEVIERVKIGKFPKDRKKLLLNFIWIVLEEKGISKEAQDLIEKMLTFNPEYRVSAREAISHPWIQKKGVKNTNLSHAQEALHNLQAFNVIYS